MVGTRRFVPALVAPSVVCAMAWAGTLTATVSDYAFYPGVAFEVEVVAEGNDIDGISPPESIDGARIDPRSRVARSEISIVNGVVRKTYAVTFMIVPSRSGELVIPPFSAVIDGQRLESEPIRLTVNQGQAIEDVFFLEIKTDKEEVYQGEPVTMTLEVWLHSDFRMTYLRSEFPDVTGFYAVPREPKEAPQRQDSRDGHRYVVQPFVQMLYPTATGTLKIGEWTWDCIIARRSTQEAVRSTKPFYVKVKPLPPAPANFTGSVGKYAIAASLSANAANPGVPIDLKVHVSGIGNPDAVGEPQIPPLTGAMLGDPKRTSFPLEDTVQAEWVYPLTVTRDSDIVVPEIPYCYFDPERAEYVTVHTQALPLRVRPLDKPEGLVVVGEGGKEEPGNGLGTDILPIVTHAGGLRRTGPRGVTAAAVIGAPMIAYAAVAAFVHRQRRFATDRAFARRYHALQLAERRLMDARHSRTPLDGLYRAVTAFLEDIYNRPEAGMTAADASLLLDQQHAPPEIAHSFIKILRTCERARYGGATLTSDETGALIDGAATAVRRLDAHIKGRAS